MEELLIFMIKISRRRRGEEGVWFGDLRMATLLSADDVVLLASSDYDLQLALGWFAVQCEAVRMRVSTQVKEFTSKGILEHLVIVNFSHSRMLTTEHK